jgi:predicted small lipoprotein YifL
MKKALLLIALLLTACGEDGPPAPTEAENHQLDEAEAMLNAAGNETGPTNRPR